MGEATRRFKFPQYTQIPNEVLDELMPALSGSELKVLLLICRKTFGFHRETETIGFSDICAGTGLGRSTAIRVVASLEEKALIGVTRSARQKATDVLECNKYFVLCEGEEQAKVADGGSPKTALPPSPKSGPGVVSNRDQGSPKTGRYIGKKESIKETGKKSSSSGSATGRLFEEDEDFSPLAAAVSRFVSAGRDELAGMVAAARAVDASLSVGEIAQAINFCNPRKASHPNYFKTVLPKAVINTAFMAQVDGIRRQKERQEADALRHAARVREIKEKAPGTLTPEDVDFIECYFSDEEREEIIRKHPGSENAIVRRSWSA